jgi:hypothetical protein
MKTNQVILTEDTFDELFKPIQNPLDKNASFSGTMLETFGDEIQYVLSVVNKDPKRVWTIIENDGDMFCSSGYHLMNRIGYIITENEWETGQEEFRYEGTYDLITDSNILDDFLMNEDSITQEMREDIIEIVYENPVFEFKKSEDNLGFILNLWENKNDYENQEEPRDVCTFWFKDYED